MNNTNQLATPIFIKANDAMQWPNDGVFYVIAGNGLFLCRNNALFSSAVPARDFPSALANQRTFCRLRYPKLPRGLLEVTVGFFDIIAEKHNSEAAALLGFHAQSQRYRIIVPKQVATVSRSRWNGQTHAIGVRYDVGTDIPPDVTILGDIHSHVDESAWSSGVDRHDEQHRPGLHIVVGHIRDEPPQFHVETVVDGMRFSVQPELVLEGYEKRRLKVPQQWIDNVTIEEYQPKYWTGSTTNSWDTAGQWKTDTRDRWRD